MMQRRQFLTGSTVAGSSVLAGLHSVEATTTSVASPFSLRFAPHPGSFRHSAGHDVLDQIRFAADEGFTAFEYNGLSGETPQMQEVIGRLLADCGMRMGVFVAYASFDRPTFAVRRKEYRDEVLAAVDAALQVAERVNAQCFTVVPGSIDQQDTSGDTEWNRYGGARLADGYQTANVIDLLRECAARVEPSGRAMVLEPLNPYANHGGLFLQRSDQAYAICRAVNSPACKILFDIYHQQITEGNLIPNIDQCWDEIAYFQSGDNPGRREPGTGEIHYANVFRHIAERSQETGRDLVIGMEHGNSIPGAKGERALIDAYRAVDPARVNRSDG